MRDLRTITRRGLVGAAGAALGAGVAGISASALASPADPDAGLVALIARHAEVLAALAALDTAADPLRRLNGATAPAAPEALQWRPADFPGTSYGRGASDAIGDMGAREYRLRGVEWLRRARPSAQWGEAAEVRRREIVGAWDGWQEERRALADRLGLTAANDVCDRASDVVEAVEMGIMDHVPATLAGFRAKAAWIASTKQPEEWCIVLMQDLAGIERVTA